MARANVYINKDNEDYFKHEENKSGLINQLLARHFKELRGKALNKQEELAKKGIVSDIDVKLSEDMKSIKATVTPDREKTMKRGEIVPTKPNQEECPNGHPIPDGRARCMGKGCKYS